MMAKPIRALELHYPMIFFIMTVIMIEVLRYFLQIVESENAIIVGKCVEIN